MKSIGQQITTMSKIYCWIDDNIDKLFKDPTLQKKFGAKKLKNNKNIEEVMAAQSIEYQKAQFRDKMMDWMEKAII